MAVILFKDGQSEKFDEFSFVDRLNEGWSFEDGVAPEPKAVEVEVVEEVAEEPIEEEAATVKLEDMTKKEIEEYARGFNIELDRRMNKTNMIKAFNEKKG
jgi:ribosomal protein L10